MNKQQNLILAGLLVAAITFSVIQLVTAAAPNPGHTISEIDTSSGSFNGQTISSAASFTGTLYATGKITTGVTGAAYFQGGDDATLNDVDVANTVGILGVQNSARGCLRLGSGAADICGSSGNVGIGTTAPTSKLTIIGADMVISATGVATTTIVGSATATSTFAGDVSVPNNTLTGCAWSAYHCNASDSCADGKFVAAVGRETGGAPGCGTAPNQYYKLRVYCCGI